MVALTRVFVKHQKNMGFVDKNHHFQVKYGAAGEFFCGQKNMRIYNTCG